MALLNIFKGKKTKKGLKREERRKEKKLVEKPAKKAAKVELPEKKQEPKTKSTAEPKPIKRKHDAKIAPIVLITPQITEKATLLQEQNDYIFKVQKLSTKPEIRKAIEEMYGVHVLGVRTINVPRKSKRLGRSQGWKQGYKKAIVRLSKDQSIEVMPR